MCKPLAARLPVYAGPGVLPIVPGNPALFGFTGSLRVVPNGSVRRGERQATWRLLDRSEDDPEWIRAVSTPGAMMKEFAKAIPALTGSALATRLWATWSHRRPEAGPTSLRGGGGGANRPLQRGPGGRYGHGLLDDLLGPS